VFLNFVRFIDNSALKPVRELRPDAFERILEDILLARHDLLHLSDGIFPGLLELSRSFSLREAARFPLEALDDMVIETGTSSR